MTRLSYAGAANNNNNKPKLNKTTKWGRISTKELLPIPNSQQQPPIVNANGSTKPDLKRSDSLSVPGNETQKPGETDGRDSPQSHGSGSVSSRRGSSRSLESRLSAIDFSKLTGQQAANVEEEVEDKPAAHASSDTLIRNAIPYLPLLLATICFILNMFLPGSGTVLSGVSVFCCGQSRIASKEDQRTQTMCINAWVGFAQFFTVPFMLVGWFWSFVWGIYIVILAVEHRKEKKAKHEKELQAMALTAFNPEMRPWTLRTE